jgi:hypothetical protein
MSSLDWSDSWVDVLVAHVGLEGSDGTQLGLAHVTATTRIPFFGEQDRNHTTVIDSRCRGQR